MAARMQTLYSDSAKGLTEQVNRLIRSYETGQVSIQVVTTVVPDQRSQAGSRILYEAFVVYPG